MYRTIKSSCAAVLAVAILACTAGVCSAGIVDGGLRVKVITAYNLVVDSNVESPSTYAPRSAFMGATFYNDGSNTLTNVVAYIGDYIDGTSDTPGLYPTNRHPAYPLIVGPQGAGYFSLTHEGGSAGTTDATRRLGDIPAGESTTVYWLISYPNLDVNGKSVTGPSIKPDDDLQLEFDVWMTAGELGVPRTVLETRPVTMRNEISAMANKILPNGANKVPQYYLDLLGLYAPSWSTTAADGSPGSQIVAEGVWYDLGNVGHGFDNDDNLVPDKNAWMQPVGDPSLFDPSCFRLVRTYAMVVVKLKGGGEDVLYAEDQLYFENIAENNGAVGWVGYEFLPLRGGCSSALSPYQEVASGFDNEKFNGDYGAALGGLLESTDPSVNLVKTADGLTAVPGDTLWYSLTYTPARQTFADGSLTLLGNPDLGLPVVIQDQIPDGTEYVEGSAAISNDLPVGVGSYDILYSTNNGAAWLSSEPSPASAVTDLRWWLSDQLAGGTTGTVRFAVTIDSPFVQPLPKICNTGGASFGETTPDTNSTVCTKILGTNTLGDTVYADNGAGAGTFGNQVQDGSEPGLSNITVTLYYDANSNGTQDAGDLLWGTQSTDTNGNYTFPDLPDGNFVAIVAYLDPDLPSGYTLTTPQTHAANLDSARTNTNTVAYVDADFGFAPVLDLTKELLGTSPVYEGREVTFRITVTNQFPGDGSGDGSTHVVTNWASARDTDKDASTGWQSHSNALGAPDDAEATVDIGSNLDSMGLTGFSGAEQGTITNAQLVIPLRSVNPLNKAFIFNVHLWTNGAAAGSLVGAYTQASLPADDTLVIDVTTNFASLTRASVSNATVQITGQKVGGSGGNDIYVDAVGFRLQIDVTTAADRNTLYPVPLFDTYDADLLRYVSSVPSAESSSTSGAAPDRVGTIRWDNIGPIYPGGTSSVLVTFDVLEPPSNQSALVTNTAYVNSATFSNGVPANTATDEVAVAIEPTAVLGDYVWRDLNGDGTQDVTEVGIPNVQLVLQPPAGVDAGNGPGVAVTNTTDVNGLYLFDGLVATNYTVTVLTITLPGGTGTNTFDWDGNKDNATGVVITNAPGGGPVDFLDADFGYQLSSTIEGIVWHDENRSETFPPDTDEDRFSSVTVGLYDSSNVLVATTNTDVTGYFQFVGPYVGDYTVRVTTNSGDMAGSGWTPSYDTDGTGTVDEVDVTVAAGGSARADFGYYLTGSFDIGDTLFYDWNGDGSQATNEEGIVGVTVSLYSDDNSNGVVDAGEVLLATDVTDASGRYLFENRATGNYIVIVDENDPDFPASVSCTADPDATCDGRSSLYLAADNLDQDFGYQPTGSGSIGDTVWRDMNADGTQVLPSETGISGVDVVLYVDLNGDSNYAPVATNTTDGDGHYLFEDLPDAPYLVVVDTTSTNIPTDGFGVRYVPSTVTSYDVTISGGNTYLDADFGYAPLGAIGDTVFWDMNASGEQEAYESGVSNVTVQLYRDVNDDGKYTPGTDTFVTSQVTDADGKYLFSGLTSQEYVVYVIATSGPLAEAVLTADPDADGLPCDDPAVSNMCDSAYGVTITNGTAFMGADFGYQPLGVLGDTVWMDVNTNGVRDAGEYGIPYITVSLYSNLTLIATNVTDSDGYYIFGNLSDGTYRVVVSTNDTDWPAGVVQVYDPDGAQDDEASSIVVSNGHVVTIGAIAYTNDLDVDFGYRYDGSNVLSGTVGLDALPYDGALGDGATSGVTSNEAAFPGVTVYAYTWIDGNGDSMVDSGETIPIANTTTDANGDYSFTGLPNGGVSNYYIVSLSAPADDLLMTTTNGSTPALWVQPFTNALGIIQSAYQVITIAPVTTNIDFAFVLSGTWDFGDLPASYSTSLQDTPEGARHRLAATPTLYLGAGVDAESNGQPSADATGDDADAQGDDEDGVVPVGYWQEGGSGGVVQVSVGAGSGWLVGWVDFDGNGTFTGSGEMIVNQAVSASGSPFSIAFDIPAGAISASTTTVLNARFRLFTGEPSIPEITYFGAFDGGEVEDYQWVLGAIGDTVWMDMNRNGLQEPTETTLESVIVYLDLNSNGIRDVSEPYDTTSSNGTYLITGVNAGAYDVAVDASTLPAGLLAVYDLDGGQDSRASVSVSAGQVRLDADFGYAGESSIGDYVWLDENSDGVQDAGESGIPDVTVRLYEAGDDDVHGTSDDLLVGMTSTDLHGGYIFTGLTAGNYRVAVDTSTLDPTLAANPTYDPDGGPNHYADTSIVTPVEIDTMDFGYNWATTPHVNGNDGVGAIGDRVWLDANGDGLQDASESGIAGVTVLLYVDADTNGTYETVLATNLTDSSGLYIFTNLAAGAYVVQVAPTNFAAGGALVGASQTGDPDDYGALASSPDNLTTAPVVLGPGDVFVNADFGYQPPAVATIGDTIFFDANADGTNNAADGDLPIAGVTVSLYDTNGNVVATALTDTNGYYLFTVAVADTYTLRVTDTRTVLAGLVQTADPDVVRDREHTLGVTLGNAYLDVDFGFTASGQTPVTGLIGDLVFLDLNTNGVADASEAMEGIEVGLYDAAGSNLIAATTTDENGLYSFGGLAAGTYTVRVTTNSLPGGGVGLVNSVDPDGGVASESVVTIGAGGIDLDQDFGYRPTVPNTIGGTLWEDLNADGALDAGESNRFAGVTVLLYDTNGMLVASATTDANGDYAFTGLPDGTYRVDVTDDADLLNGYWHSDGASDGADNNSQDDPYTVSVSGGQTDTTGDFGYYVRPAAVGNRVWEDTDGDGVQDAGEPGVSGVVVFLEIAYPNGTTVTVATVTSGTGAYAFGDLLNDEDYNGDGGGPEPSYRLTATPPAGYVATLVDASGADDREDSDAAGVSAQPVQGATDVDLQADPLTEAAVAGYDFGLLALADLSGTVIEDANTNGVYDVGVDTNFLSGVTITLYDPTNGVVATTTTDSSGDYAFTNLWPGVYTVIETDPPKYSSTGDVYGTNDNTIVRTLASGDSSTGNDYLDVRDEPVLALLSSFRAFARGGDVVVEWRTAMEYGTIGFFLERRAADGSYHRINETLIPAVLAATSSGTYECIDASAVFGGTYTYRLIEIENTGRRRYLGPYTVVVDGLALSLADWSRSVFSAAQLADAAVSGDAADPDGDGLTNYEEYLAGTDPNLAVSCLRLTGIERGSSGITILWLSGGERHYVVEVADMPGSTFSVVEENLAATPPQNAYVDTLNRPVTAVYRVRLVLPAE